MFDFDLVPGPAVQAILDADRSRIVDIIRETYLAHHAGDTVNPDSYFLLFPDKPDARIIALPAFLGAGVRLAGMKWVSSFPANTALGIPRAAAVMLRRGGFAGTTTAIVGAGSARFVADLDPALRADTVIFATTAVAPYVTRPFAPGQVVLHLSLRDIAPEVVLAADNILDDVEHCLRAATSPHLAEQATGSREFVTGTLAGVLTGAVTLAPDRPVIFSPFGLGVLDIAVGGFVLEQARKAGTSQVVHDFFATTRRW